MDWRDLFTGPGAARDWIKTILAGACFIIAAIGLVGFSLIIGG